MKMGLIDLDCLYSPNGHEIPYNIKMGAIRDLCRSQSGDDLSESIKNILQSVSSDIKCEFSLNKTKHSPQKHTIDLPRNKKLKKTKKSPLIRNPFRRANKCVLFGKVLDDNVPKPVMDLLTILFREGPYTTGILRKSPNQKTVRELREKLDDGEDLPTEPISPLVAGALIKEYIRKIPDSLMMWGLFNDWVNVSGVKDEQERINGIKGLLQKLPDVNINLLKHIICVLWYINENNIENKMNSKNLAICLSPSLLVPPDGVYDNPVFCKVTQTMIDEAPTIFGEDVLNMFGEPPHKVPYSSTDSDSLHSLLSGNDGSIDSIYNICGTTSSHNIPSPNNLSRDSGLLSDNPLDDDLLTPEEGTEERPFLRKTNSQEIDRKTKRYGHLFSRSYDDDFEEPVPPPRKPRRPPYNQSLSFNVNAGRWHAEKFESDPNLSNFNSYDDMGMLVKSRSGGRLFYTDEESNSPPQRSIDMRKKLIRQSSVDSSPTSPLCKSIGSSDSMSFSSNTSIHNIYDSGNLLSDRGDIHIAYSSASSEDQDEVETVIPQPPKEFRSSFRLSLDSNLPLKRGESYSTSVDSGILSMSNNSMKTSRQLSECSSIGAGDFVQSMSLDSKSGNDFHVESESENSQSHYDSDTSTLKKKHRSEFTFPIIPQPQSSDLDEPLTPSSESRSTVYHFDGKSSPSSTSSPKPRSNKSSPSFTSSPRPRSSSMDDIRPPHPPSYEEALHRNCVMSQNFYTKISEEEFEVQRQNNERAKRLYEQSMKMVQENATTCKPVQLQRHDEIPEEEEYSDYVTLRPDPKKLYEDSLKMAASPLNVSPLSKLSGGPPLSASQPISQVPIKNPKLIYEQSLQKFAQETGSVYPANEVSYVLHRRQSMECSNSSYDKENISPQEYSDSRTHLRHSMYHDSPNATSLHRSMSDSQENKHKLELFRQKYHHDNSADSANGDRPFSSMSSRSRLHDNASHSLDEPTDNSGDVSHHPSANQCINDNYNRHHIYNTHNRTGAETHEDEKNEILKSTVSTSCLTNFNQSYPWSVKNLRSIYDRSDSSEKNEDVRPPPPPYQHPPPFQRLSDTNRTSVSSSSSVGSERFLTSSMPQRSGSYRYGPQCVDYNSSADDSDTSSRWRSDSGSSDDLEYSDITYV